MLLKFFYDSHLAQASYLVGCASNGEALVIDPARDITPYLQAAHHEALTITHVTETHIHADFVSGIRELAAHTGARVHLSAMGGTDWQYGFAGEALRDGDQWHVGNVRIEAMHTPGHTPEHLTFMATDTVRTDQPVGLFTGDFVFVGDVGRPDLLETAAGVVGSKEVGARQLFHSLQKLKALPDYLQIWPGHGAGSACGKALGALPSSTLGYEKLFNPAFQYDDEAAFVKWLLEGQPEVPHYFGQMKRVNKAGAALLRDLTPPQRLGRAALEQALAEDALVIDLRDQQAFAGAHVPGTISIPSSSKKFSTYIGWLVDYEKPLYVILPDEGALAEVLTALRAIGVDNVPGYFLPEVVTQGKTNSLKQINAHELAARATDNGLVVLDVRGQSEYDEVHIEDALHVPLGYIPQRLADIPRNRTIVAQCSSGYRSQVAASLLRKYGYEDVLTLNDSEAEWVEAMPTVQG